MSSPGEPVPASAEPGEFGRIRRFFAPLAGPGSLDLEDDAALIGCPPGRRLVVTVDTIIEGVDYLPDDPPDLVARKLLRVNLSDLAAMGAEPRHYLVSTALPAALGVEWLAGFASGLEEDQARFGVRLVGGDSAATPGPAVLTLTAIGEVAEGAEIRRRGARPGDRLWVSGTIGDSFLGLAVLRGEYPTLPSEQRSALIGRYHLPEPRTRLGPALVGLARAMIDVSDGLLADLGHLCEASRVSASVEAACVPLSAAAQDLVASAPRLIASLAGGGDDYELLFAAAPEDTESINRVAAKLALRVTPIGWVASGAGVRLVDVEGKDLPIEKAGWRHF